MSDATLYDADAVIAALEPPRLKFRGEVHTGRLLSWKEMQTWNAEFDQLLARTDATEQQYAAFAERLLDAMGFPVELIGALPAGIVWDVAGRFLAASRAARTRPQDEPPPPTPGNSSPSAASGSVPPG